MKKPLSPVAIPRVILKKSDTTPPVWRSRTLDTGKRVHFASLARALAATSLVLVGAARVPPKENFTWWSLGGSDLRNQTTADDTSASANWTSLGDRKSTRLNSSH